MNLLIMDADELDVLRQALEYHLESLEENSDVDETMGFYDEGWELLACKRILARALAVK